jgi:hypothetical protein
MQAEQMCLFLWLSGPLFLAAFADFAGALKAPETL